MGYKKWIEHSIAYKKQMNNEWYYTLKVHPIWFEFQVSFQPVCKGYVSPDAAASGAAADVSTCVVGEASRHRGIA